jgi:hypothetical protein
MGGTKGWTASNLKQKPTVNYDRVVGRSMTRHCDATPRVLFAAAAGN